VYVPPPFTWQGFYGGVNIGGAWAHTTITDNATGASFSSGTPSAFVGGGQIGYNFQFGPVVLGVEGFFDGIAGNNNNRNTSNIIIGANGNSFQATARTSWVGSIAGRLGFAAAPNWLVYGKGGGAWVGYHADLTDITTATTVSTSGSRSGWLAGGGVEWAFSPNVSAKLEYDYIGLQTRSIAPIFTADRFSMNKPNVQMVTVGLNFLFH
jgi:outer membrane immunogenic protein